MHQNWSLSIQISKIFVGVGGVGGMPLDPLDWAGSIVYACPLMLAPHPKTSYATSVHMITMISVHACMIYEGSLSQWVHARAYQAC